MFFFWDCLEPWFQFLFLDWGGEHYESYLWTTLVTSLQSLLPVLLTHRATLQVVQASRGLLNVVLCFDFLFLSRQLVCFTVVLIDDHTQTHAHLPYSLTLRLAPSSWCPWCQVPCLRTLDLTANSSLPLLFSQCCGVNAVKWLKFLNWCFQFNPLVSKPTFQTWVLSISLGYQVFKTMCKHVLPLQLQCIATSLLQLLGYKPIDCLFSYIHLGSQQDLLLLPFEQFQNPLFFFINVTLSEAAIILPGLWQ